MASEVKLSFFEKMFLDQQRRKEVLFDHARMNLTLLTFYSAFMLFVAEKMRPETDLNATLFLCSAIFMMIAFAFSLWATQISSYEGLFNPQEVLDMLDEDEISDEDFRVNRMADFAIAYERNKEVNDGKASVLFLSRLLLLLGLCFHFLYFMSMIFMREV